MYSKYTLVDFFDECVACLFAVVGVQKVGEIDLCLFNLTKQLCFAVIVSQLKFRFIN